MDLPITINGWKIFTKYEDHFLAKKGKEYCECELFDRDIDVKFIMKTIKDFEEYYDIKLPVIPIIDKVYDGKWLYVFYGKMQNKDNIICNILKMLDFNYRTGYVIELTHFSGKSEFYFNPIKIKKFNFQPGWYLYTMSTILKDYPNIHNNLKKIQSLINKIPTWKGILGDKNFRLTDERIYYLIKKFLKDLL